MTKTKSFDSGNLPSILPSGYLRDRLLNIRKNGLPKGFYTGVESLDKVFRLDKGRLITVTGIPNCGKSEFVDFLCVTYNKRYKLKTLYFSPENQPSELHLAKLISKYTEKPFETLSQSDIDRAFTHIQDNLFFYNYDKVRTLEDIIGEFEKLIKDTPVDILVLDAYNKIESDKPSGELETEFISKILDRLCNLAIKHDVMVILVAHPKKMEWRSNDRTAQCPTAYDINGSANFFNKSDYVLAVHRDRKEDDESVVIRVDKVKFSHYGNQGKCHLKYHKESGNYYSVNIEDVMDGISTGEYEPDNFLLPEAQSRKSPLDVMVSIYKGATDNIGTEVCLKDFLLSDAYRGIAEQIRKGKTPEERHEIKDRLKGLIPCATIAGRFSQRDSKHLTEASGLIGIDIDLKDNVDIMPQVPSILQRLNYVVYCGKSISGDGYFAVIKLENPKHFKQHYLALEQEMRGYGITLDKSCKDMTRLRFASYDSEGYYNPEATSYYWEVDVAQPSTKKERHPLTSSSSLSDEERVRNEIEFVKQNRISLPDDYDTWFKMGMALSNSFGEEGRKYFHEVSSTSEKYDRYVCDNQYDEIREHYPDGSEITLGTLFHIINEAKNRIS